MSIVTTFTNFPPRVKRLGWVLGDYDKYGMSGIEYHEKKLGVELYNDVNGVRQRTFGIPLPVPYFDISATDTTEGTVTRQIALEIFGRYAPKDWTFGRVRQAWLGVMSDDRAFADYGGADGARYNPRISTKNIVYIMSTRTTRMGGRDLWPVRMLKVGSYTSMMQQLVDYPLLPFNASTSTRGHGGRQVDPFWFLNGNHCKVLPFFKSEINYLDAENVRILDPYESIPNSYYPYR